MPLGTTTWRNRNIDTLLRSREVAKELEIKNPIVLNYGPGGTVYFLLEYLPRGNKHEWSTLTALKRGFIKPAESLLRKTNCSH